MMTKGSLTIPKLDGVEIQPGVTLIGEPSPVPGSDKLRCLANILGCLAIVELRIKFYSERNPNEI